MKYLGIIAAILVIAIALSLQLGFQDNSAEEKIKTLRLIYSVDTSGADDNFELGESYYTEASLAYEQQEWDLIVSKCELARKYYSFSSQDYLNERAEIEGIDIEIVQTYANILEYSSKVSLNMYEVCEHFESAARYYKKYYAPTTPYSDVSYDMGGGEIDMMNDKIEEHDANVKEYNLLLSKYNKQMREFLE